MEEVHLFAVLPKYFVKSDVFSQTHTGKTSRTLLAEEVERQLNQYTKGTHAA